MNKKKSGKKRKIKTEERLLKKNNVKGKKGLINNYKLRSRNK